MALDKGAQAVIFDVSDDANAAAEVSAQTQSYSYINLQMIKDRESSQTFHFTLVFLHTAARNGLPSASSRAGGGGGRRGVDGSGQQERGGQSSY